MEDTRAAALQSRVFEEQTQQLYAKGGTALAANLVNSLILVLALWNTVAHGVALPWLLAMWVTVALRFVLLHRHNSAQERPYRALRWARSWIVSTAITGAIWGAGGALLYPKGWPGGQDLVLFVIGGMVAGASSSLSSLLPAFVAFTFPALAPPVIRLLAEQDRLHGGMALLLCIFGIAMTTIARMGTRTLVESIRMRVRNEELATDLSATSERLLHLNKELEERVTARTEDLEKAMRARDDFVSIVSHELRSPLSAILSSEEVLRRLLEQPEIDRERLLRALDVISRQLGRTSRLVEDLFDVTRLSTERMTYARSPVDLDDIVAETLEEVAPQLALKGTTFAVGVEAGLRGNWDRWRMQQVLVNLVSNALKYGCEPYSLSARRIRERAQIIVRDSGPGIPAEDLPHVFDAFHRGASTGATGLGLGLYIAERIATAHGGSIHAESAPGQGTSIVVELPLTGGPGSPTRPRPGDPEPGGD
jgi:signal transduction histidine kinase